MATEIGARNFADISRYNLLKVKCNLLTANNYLLSNYS